MINRFALLATLALAGFAQAQVTAPGSAQPYALNASQDFFRGVVTDVRIIRPARQDRYDRFGNRDGYDNREPQAPASNDMTGAVVGGVLGAVAGNLIGGNSKTLGTVVGAVGGAYLGNQIAANGRQEPAENLRLTVRRDDGGTSTVMQPVEAGLSFQRGDVVSVINDQQRGWHAVK